MWQGNKDKMDKKQADEEKSFVARTTHTEAAGKENTTANQHQYSHSSTHVLLKVHCDILTTGNTMQNLND